MDTTPAIRGPLEIVYRDEYMVAINKPCGLLTHRSNLAKYADSYALQMLRSQLNQFVYPAHRLDRKTSGVLLFSMNPDIASLIQREFQEKRIVKKYIAIVRGFFPGEVKIDYDLTNNKGKVQPAITAFKLLISNELPFCSDRYPRSRYSLIEARPLTGRMHQIRKHLSHLNHPIIGDRPHGCNKQNRFFKNHFNMDSMLLHALELKLTHPVQKKEIKIVAKPGHEFIRMMKELNLQQKTELW